MQSVRDGVIKTQEKQSIYSRQPWIGVIIILGLTIFYVVIFHSMINNVGPVGAALIAIPVAMAGWFFGVNAGLAASLLGIILNTALLTAFEENNLILGITIGWPGNIIAVLAGYIAGRLHNEFIKRKRMIDELHSRDRYPILLSAHL